VNELLAHGVSQTTLVTLLLLLLAIILYRLNDRCRMANRAEWGSFWLNRLDGLNRLFCRYYHRLEPVTLPLPDQGGAVVVSNHVSGLDPLLMIASSRRPLRFLIAREQYQRFGLRWLFRAVGCIPVNRESSPEKALRQAFKALQQGEVVALFPHGKIHLDRDPPRKIKAGASRLASKTKVPLVAVRISGVSVEGHVLLPVLLRSRAKIELRAKVTVSDQSPDELNGQIQVALDTAEPLVQS
jgi:1-acyl-sn-glycerol-3-phosphate acyltransferase